MTIPDIVLEGIRREKYERAKRRASSKTLHPGQRKIYDDSHRYRVVACGRRFGKTEVGKREIIDAGKRGEYWWWVSPNHKMAIDVWRDLIAETAGVRSLLYKSDREIIFPSGGRLRVVSAHEPENLRGSGLDGLVVDEAAFCPERVWHVLRPALSDRQGRALFLSTPNGKNWFFRLYQRGADPLEEGWQSWQMPTSANPHIDAREIADARRDMPERQYFEEFEAVFSEDYGTVFRGVLDVATLEPQEPQAGGDYVFGVDWGKSNDFTVITAIDKVTAHLVWMQRFNQISWEHQRGRLKTGFDRYHPRTIIAEHNSIGDPNIEALQREGLPVQPFITTNASKGQIIDALALAIERKEITLLNDPVLINELQSYEMQRLPGGSWRYGAPSGAHDDCVISLALAWSAVNKGSGIWF